MAICVRMAIHFFVSLTNTKLEDFVNLGVLFLTMWINSCLSDNLLTLIYRNRVKPSTCSSDIKVTNSYTVLQRLITRLVGHKVFSRYRMFSSSLWDGKRNHQILAVMFTKVENNHFVKSSCCHVYASCSK